MKMKNILTTGTKILLERSYDDTVWQVAGLFDRNDSGHYSDGQLDRRSYALTKNDVKFLSPLWNRASVGVEFDNSGKVTFSAY